MNRYNHDGLVAIMTVFSVATFNVLFFHVGSFAEALRIRFVCCFREVSRV